MYDFVKVRGIASYDLDFAEEGEYRFRFEFLSLSLQRDFSALVVGDVFVILVLVFVRYTIVVVGVVIFAIIVISVAICIVCGSGSILYINSPIIVYSNTSVTREIIHNLLKLPHDPFTCPTASSIFLLTIPISTTLKSRSK